MSNGTGYLDRDDLLKNWGFDGNSCLYCGIKNSELSGLLMQCGKCKKAYYCGMKCFNADLPRHQTFCGTQAITQQPKKSLTEDVTLDRIVTDVKDVKVVEDLPDEQVSPKPSTSPKSKGKKKVKKEEKEDKKKKKEKKEKKEKKSKKEEEVEEPTSPLPTESVPVSIEPTTPQQESAEPEVVTPVVEKSEPQPALPEPVSSVNIDSILYAEEDDDDDSCENDYLSPIKSYRGSRAPSQVEKEKEKVSLRRVEIGPKSQLSPAALERVDLKNAEYQKRELEKYRPDWVDTNLLRQTEIGELIKTAGDLKYALNATGAKEKSEIPTQIPEWTKTPLRKTACRAKVLQGGGLYDKLNFKSPHGGPCLLENQESAQRVPEWLKTPLKKTEAGHKIKQGIDPLRIPKPLL